MRIALLPGHASVPRKSKPNGSERRIVQHKALIIYDLRFTIYDLESERATREVIEPERSGIVESSMV